MGSVREDASRKGRLSKTFWLAAFTTFWMLCVNMFGFVDTFTGSSLSLGRTWPFTNQGLFPATWNVAKFIEYTHRVLVSGLLILLLLVSVIAWIKYRRWVEVKILSLVSIIFVFIEAILGAMAVLMATPPLVAATHMGVALIAFCAVTVLTSVIASVDRRNLRVTGEALRPVPVSKAYARWTWITLGYILFAIYFGSFVAATGDGGLFRGWPLPTESYAKVHGALTVDIAHRTVAVGLLVLLMSLTVIAKRREKRQDLFRVGLLLLVLTVLQAISGAILIYTQLSTGAFLLHVGIVTCIFAVSAYMAFKVLPEFRRNVLKEPNEDSKSDGKRRRDSALA